MTKSNFVWFEYVAKDVERAKGFYGELFNWKTQTIPMAAGEYTMIQSGDAGIGGYFPMAAADKPAWLSYFSVADARAAEAKLLSLGGKVMKPVSQIGDFGLLSVVSDPQGGAFALWQPLKDEGGPPKGKAGTFCWNELYSNDPTASVAFYRALGELSETSMDMGPMGTYHILQHDEQNPVAGIMKAQADQPHMWLPYVQVDNTDETAAKAKRLGANVYVQPTDIPNIGRFAVFIDPVGAAIAVLQPAK